MRKKIEWLWEQLDEATWRSKVIGGWLVLHVKTFAFVGGKGNAMSQSESMQFVADRDHEWHILLPLVGSNKPQPTINAADFSSK